MIEDQPVNRWCDEALQGSHEAAGKLIQHFHPLIFAYLRRVAGNDADAADLTQQTFSRAWQSLARFRKASSVTTWLHRIAYCVYVDWMRQRPPHEETSDFWWETLPADTPSPFDSLEQADFARHLYAMVEELEPASCRAAIHLHYYQGLSLAETSEVLEVPVSTLKYQLRTSLDDLRTRLRK
jgi:RNA polymerase sigma-70 factor (ECF subfamily)